MKNIIALLLTMAFGFHSQASDMEKLISCYKGLSDTHNSLPYPPHIPFKVPPDISFDQGKILDGFFLLSNPSEKGRWTIYGPAGAYDIKLEPSDSGYFSIEIPKHKKMLIRRTLKKSTYLKKEGKDHEFEEMLFHGANPSQYDLDLLKKTGKEPMKIMAKQSVSKDAEKIISSEILRRLNTVHLNFTENKDDIREIPMMTEELWKQDHIDSIKHCQGIPGLEKETRAELKKFGVTVHDADIKSEKKSEGAK